MRIAETFYSLQGEGTLTGVPSWFLRTAGCNLRCRWCDSAYAWLRSGGRERDIAGLVAEALAQPTRFCVLTGGEPLLAEGIHDLAGRLVAAGRHVTIETAATVPPRGIACSLASLSPKLANSTPGSDASAARRRRHEARRLRLDVIREWLAGYDCQLKFVIASAGDIAEVAALLAALERPVAPERVLLMPEGGDAASLARVAGTVAAACQERGFRYCDRLHVRLYGNRRGR